MKARWRKDVFVRNFADEVLIWHRRSYACLIVDGISAFAKHMSVQWRELDAIYDSLSLEFGTSCERVRSDYASIVEELVASDFLELDSFVSNSDNSPVVNESLLGLSEDGGVTPLESFFEKHEVPMELHVDVTASCTERCVHCYLPEYPNKHISFDLLKKVLFEFRELQGLTVYLTGGECMLHPDFERICCLCSDLNLNVVVLSNLTLCNNAKLNALKALDPQFVNVSLYSMNPKVHDSITSLCGSWRKTMGSILACERAGIHVRLAAPLLKANKEDFGALCEFAKAHKMHLVSSFNIVPQSNHNASNLEYSCGLDELKTALESNRELFDEGWGRKNVEWSEGGICDIGKLRIYVNSIGDYYPCDSMHGYVLGNAVRNSLESIWRGERINELRNLSRKDYPRCAHCRNRLYCKVCPAFNFNATGDVLKIPLLRCATAGVVRRVYGDK